MENQKDYIGTQFSDADYQDAIKVDRHTGRQAMLEEHNRLKHAENNRNAEKERLAKEQEEADKKEFEEFKTQRAQKKAEQEKEGAQLTTDNGEA
jgi:hypothetical protein